MPTRVAADFRKLYPDSSPRATEATMNIVQTADLLTSRVAGLIRRFALTPASGLTLSLLANAPVALSPHEISERMIVSRATVTGLVDSLERRGYVRRVPHPSDRRMLLVEITKEGLATAHHFRPIVHRHERIWMETLREDEQETLITLLGRVQERLATLPPDETPPSKRTTRAQRADTHRAAASRRIIPKTQ